METIPKSECEKIGYLKKTHGVRGELVLEFEPQFEVSIENANRFFVEIDGLLVPEIPASHSACSLKIRTEGFVLDSKSSYRLLMVQPL